MFVKNGRIEFTKFIAIFVIFGLLSAIAIQQIELSNRAETIATREAEAVRRGFGRFNAEKRFVWYTRKVVGAVDTVEVVK
jgi:hypothetical protein